MKFEIGVGSSVHLGCKFTAVTEFSMGKNSTINQYCRIDNRGGIYIGNNVSISPIVSLITADHDVYTHDCSGRQKSITINDYVFIGSDAMILPGADMETGSVLAAKSLLNKPTLSYGIYAGIPASYKAKRPENLDYSGSYIRWFH
ncbi:MAG: acyltransferase [Sphingobacteriaceae bacterium]|nr:MAG: acyltransferase [Sphingobacteriaceae bacterium]